ncbi:hypothetical protein GCM10022251_81040 [Phytohabitans flavus]
MPKPVGVTGVAARHPNPLNWAAAARIRLRLRRLGPTVVCRLPPYGRHTTTPTSLCLARYQDALESDRDDP